MEKWLTRENPTNVNIAMDTVIYGEKLRRRRFDMEQSESYAEKISRLQSFIDKNEKERTENAKAWLKDLEIIQQLRKDNKTLTDAYTRVERLAVDRMIAMDNQAKSIGELKLFLHNAKVRIIELEQQLSSEPKQGSEDKK